MVRKTADIFADAGVASSIPDRALRHLNQLELARRWNLSERTLEGWRARRQGPPFLKLGGRISYRQADIERFEESHSINPLAFGGRRS